MRDESSASHAHDAEEWRPVVGLGGRYEVSSLGRVRVLWTANRRMATPLVMRLHRSTNGYADIQMVTGVGSVHRRVHHLVLEAFVGPCPSGLEASHVNGSRLDNRLENLCWETHAENMARQVAHGTRYGGDAHYARTSPERLARGDRSGARLHPDRLPRGSAHGMAKLTEADAAAILAAVARGDRPGTLAAVYGVRATAISDIVLGRTWRHVSGAEPRAGERRYGEANPDARLTTDAVRAIRAGAAGGESHATLAARYGVGKSTIGRIVRREKWAHVP